MKLKLPSWNLPAFVRTTAATSGVNKILADSNVSSFSQQQLYQLEITVADAQYKDTFVVSISVVDKNEPPSFPENVQFNLNENSAQHDADRKLLHCTDLRMMGDRINVYGDSYADGDGGSFSPTNIFRHRHRTKTSKTLRVTNGADVSNLDFETLAQRRIILTVVVTDDGKTLTCRTCTVPKLSSQPGSITVSVNDINEPPTSTPNFAVTNVPEDSSVGFPVVATACTAGSCPSTYNLNDPDEGQDHQFTFNVEQQMQSRVNSSESIRYYIDYP